MGKQLSISKLREVNKAFDEFVEIPVDVAGEEYIVKMYPFFSEEKKRDLVNDLVDFYKKANEEKLEIPQIEEDDLVGFFIIKHFTNLKLTSSKKAKKLYEDFKTALNAPLFKLLMKSFPQESITQVYDRIYEVIEMSAAMENRIKAFQQQVNDLPLENRDVIFGKKKQIPEK